MRIGILASGPSLTSYLANPVAYDCLIGVNRAIEAIACRFWVFTDPAAYLLFRPSNRPTIFTSESCRRMLNEQNAETREQCNRWNWLYHEDVNTECPSDRNWRNLSVTTGLILAQHLRAAEIHCHGVDQCGTRDWLGSEVGGSGRSAYRWNNEVHWYGQVVYWLNQCGINVYRHLSDRDVLNG